MINEVIVICVCALLTIVLLIVDVVKEKEDWAKELEEEFKEDD